MVENDLISVSNIEEVRRLNCELGRYWYNYLQNVKIRPS